jgi:hypothetical protein
VPRCGSAITKNGESICELEPHPQVLTESTIGTGTS